MHETLAQCGENLCEVAADTNGPEAGERVNPTGPAAVVLDKGYHSNDVLVSLKEVGVRSYCSEPARGRRNWQGKAAEQAAVYQNRRRMRRERGKSLSRQRGERVERSFAHMYETGAMRKVMGCGTPRGMLDRVRQALLAFWLLCEVMGRVQQDESAALCGLKA